MDYRIWNTALGVHVEMNVRFEPGAQTTPAQFQDAYTVAERCRQPIQAVWGRYGVTLHLNFDRPDQTRFPFPDHLIALEHGAGRSNSSRIYVAGQGFLAQLGIETGPHEGEMCKALLHELGHLMGLPDEYRDRACPDRPFVSRENHPYSVMNNQNHAWEEIGFYPRHIRTVVGPLCRWGENFDFGRVIPLTL